MSSNDELSADIAHNLSQVASNDTQTARRNLIRSLTAYIEYALSDWKMYIPPGSQEDLSELDSAILDDHIIHITDDGEKRRAKLKVPIRGRIVAKLKIIEKIIDNNESYISKDDIKNIDELFKIRDLITHPKPHSNIDISDENFTKCITSAYNFFGKYATINEKLIEMSKNEMEFIKKIVEHKKG